MGLPAAAAMLGAIRGLMRQAREVRRAFGLQEVLPSSCCHCNAAGFTAVFLMLLSFLSSILLR